MNKVLTLILSGAVACLILSGFTSAQTPGAASPLIAGNVQTVTATEHPLMPVIRWAERERPNIAAIKDYTAVMHKQENIGGKVQGAQVMEIKVRHQPFSVYTKFRFPQDLNGQQAIYVDGQNDNKLIAHGVGIQRRAGTLRLDPNGFLAMQNQRYPITEMGILNLVDKLLEVGYADSKFGECEVAYYEGVKVGTGPSARECTEIRVTHPVPRQNFRFHIARIFVDKELNIPIRYESYDWPRREGETPMLIEAYTYTNLQMNVGLTDADFDPANPAYNFP